MERWLKRNPLLLTSRIMRKIDERYRDTNGWAKTVMTNTAKAGKFSSDRTIEEYATEIWKLTKTPVEM